MVGLRTRGTPIASCERRVRRCGWDWAGVAAGLLVLGLGACTRSVSVHGTYADVYERTKAAMLGAGFIVENAATGTVGEEYANGRIDFTGGPTHPEWSKFSGREFVTVRIVPHGDSDSRSRTISMSGWRYSWVSVATFGLYTDRRAHMQNSAAKAIEAAFAGDE